MPKLIRFGVSLEDELLKSFDAHIRQQSYTCRSEAIRDLIREALLKKQWDENKAVAGAIMLIYDHHKRQLVNTLTDIQHDFGGMIIATQHVHLDHHHCLEIVAVKGLARDIQSLADRLRAVKGVFHSALSITGTGTHP